MMKINGKPKLGQCIALYFNRKYRRLLPCSWEKKNIHFPFCPEHYKEAKQEFSAEELNRMFKWYREWVESELREQKIQRRLGELKYEQDLSDIKPDDLLFDAPYDGILELEQIRKEKERNRKRKARGIAEEKWPELEKKYWTQYLISWAREHRKEHKDLTLKKFNRLSPRDKYWICSSFWDFENTSERQLGSYEVLIIWEIMDDAQKLYDVDTDMEFQSEEEHTAYYVSGERGKRLEEIYGPEEEYDEEIGDEDELFGSQHDKMLNSIKQTVPDLLADLRQEDYGQN